MADVFPQALPGFTAANWTFFALISIQLFCAITFGFGVFPRHRALIWTLVPLQAVWRCYIRCSRAWTWSRSNNSQTCEPWTPWLQMILFQIVLEALDALIDKPVARVSPAGSSTTKTAATANNDDDSERSNTTKLSPPLLQFPDQTRGPWFLPCATSHHRTFPQKHGFAYSYLQVAFRVGATGVHGGNLLGIETRRGKEHQQHDQTARRSGQRDAWTWFSISADDYLQRGRSADGTLLCKLHEYLATQGVEARELPFAYLVTAPRFLGYSFNPVSFWYLYGVDRRLRYMLLEVNNTFDERRIYLLEAEPDASANTNGDIERSNEALGKKQRVFRQTWPKDFHVSPFNSRKGSYSLLAHDPGFANKAAADDGTPLRIDNTITLNSSKAHPKLVARLYSTDPALPLSTPLGLGHKSRFLAAWCWPGFMTFPRILREAGRLFFVRRLHVWFRPEVLRSSIGRQPTACEGVLGGAFGRFVRRRCRAGDAPPLAYSHALALPGPRTRLLGLDDASDADADAADHLQVLSPLFYTQFALDADVLGSKVLQDAPTVSVRGADAGAGGSSKLPTTRDDGAAMARVKEMLSGDQPGETGSPAKIPFRWRLLRSLRRISGSKDGRHPLDDMVLGERAGEPLDLAVRDRAESYRRAVTWLLLARIFTFDSPELLDALVWVWSAVVVWAEVNAVSRALVVENSRAAW